MERERSHGQMYENAGDASASLQEEYRRLEQQLIMKKGELAQMMLMLRGEREQRRKLEESLQIREHELRRTAGDLDEANTTLKVLMNRADIDRNELFDRFETDIRQGIFPCLNRLKAIKQDEKSREYLHLIESRLQTMISPVPTNLKLLNRVLTPTEIQVAYMVREGKITKEISSFMNLSDKAVEFHRNNIRKKLGLKEKKENLKKYLMSLEHASS